MLIVKNKRYMRKYVIGGAGIFDTISNFLKKLAASNAAQKLASVATKAAATTVGKTAISSLKTVGKELATSAISTAADLAIAKGKQLIDKTSKKVLSPKYVEMINNLALPTPNAPVIKKGLSPKYVEMINNLANPMTNLINSGATEATTNINKLMMGQGIKSNAKNAVRIEDLVRQMNGAGLRLA